MCQIFTPNQNVLYDTKIFYTDVDLDLNSLQIETEDKPSLSSIQSGRWCVAPLKYLMIRKRFRNSISQHQGYSERQ